MRVLFFFIAFSGTVWSFAQPLPTTHPAKKLIEFGWDEPDTAYLRQHIEQMERTAFDGCVFHFMYDKPDHTRGSFMNECWGRRSFAADDVKSAREDLLATRFSSFAHNFVRFNVLPGDVDWFDDFSAVVANARLTAEMASLAKCDGVLFDTEPYNVPSFDYREQELRASKSFDEYAAQARQRGREIMQAFQQGKRDLVVLLTFGHTLAYRQSGTDRSKLAEAECGLLAPFLDGMFDAAEGRSKIVDGYEISYGYRMPGQFEDVPVILRQNVSKIIGCDMDRFRHHASLGFGLWMDYDWARNGWDVADVSKNYFTPDLFQKSIRKALATADEYVWIYSETPRWWAGEDAKPLKLPEAYLSAVQHGRGD